MSARRDDVEATVSRALLERVQVQLDRIEDDVQRVEDRQIEHQEFAGKLSNRIVALETWRDDHVKAEASREQGEQYGVGTAIAVAAVVVAALSLIIQFAVK